MNCPFCQSPLLFSEDRGSHCDGCDEYGQSLAAPDGSVTAMEKPIEIPLPRDGGSLHPLVGRSVSVRNHYERSGLFGMETSDLSGEVPGAGHYLEGVIVQVTERNLRSKTVRVGYPAKYFAGTMPRYGTVAMRHLRSPNVRDDRSPAKGGA